jgi:hypothetical protein
MLGFQEDAARFEGPEAGSDGIVTFRLTFTERGDGGLRVRSDEIPGLLSSSNDIRLLWSGLPIVIRSLLETNHGVKVHAPLLGEPPDLAAGESVTRVFQARRRDPG